MTVFFTADQHFNHSNIIKYCNRPFKDSEDQTEQLITNWNSVVDAEDEVWVLGDFFFFYKPRKNNEKEMIIYDKNTGECKEILSRLNGKINLIIGNHDIRPDEQYKEMVRYFQTFIQKNQPVYKEVPLGLQAIFANRMEHWAGDGQIPSIDSVRQFCFDYERTGVEYYTWQILHQLNTHPY
jgi:predicted phosphohydrolase